MPSYQDVLAEVLRSSNERGAAGPDLRGIRLKYIRRIRRLSGRAVIVYGSGWLGSERRGVVSYFVEGPDVPMFMAACKDIDDPELDLVLHSPGGAIPAAEQIINYLRRRFKYIRALIPLQAKSAATILALGCDELVMGEHSELGPIDAQVPVPPSERLAPAHAVLRDFERHKAEAERSASPLYWSALLERYPPGLLEMCHQHLRMAQDVVAVWLENHMLSHPDANVEPGARRERAVQLAEYFGSEEAYDRFHTHDRPVRIEELQTLPGLRVRRLEDNPALQDALVTLYHSMDISFALGQLGGQLVKVVENHRPGGFYERWRPRPQREQEVPSP